MTWVGSKLVGSRAKRQPSPTKSVCAADPLIKVGNLLWKIRHVWINSDGIQEHGCNPSSSETRKSNGDFTLGLWVIMSYLGLVSISKLGFQSLEYSVTVLLLFRVSINFHQFSSSILHLCIWFIIVLATLHTINIDNGDFNGDLMVV